MSIWSMPMTGNIARGQVWSDEGAAPGYTGGDMEPLPVPGGIVYTRYDRNPDGSIIGQLWFTHRPGSFRTALTAPRQGCREPSLSPARNHLALARTPGHHISDLVIAP